MAPPDAPPAAEPSRARELASLLVAAGFDGTADRERLGGLADRVPAVRDVPVHARRIGDLDALALLLRLLVLELPVEPRDLLSEPLVDALVATGVAGPAGELLRPRCCLRSQHGLLLASDRHTDTGRHDFVPGAQEPSWALADLTVRRPVERALDVGTGYGVQALLPARHARRVVATDVSARALDFAAFNAALNGIDSLELRPGSFFAPVAGERFDLVVCNPPFVISPADEYVFRDGRMRRDGVSELVTRAAADALADRGFGSLLVAWVDDGREPAPRRWLAGSGCAAWLLGTARHEALEAAAGWNAGEADPAAYAARVEEWLDYYRRERIEAIGYGALVLRRGGPVWFQAANLASSGPAGGQLERLFAGQDAIATLTDDELAAARPLRASDAVLVRETRAGRVSWTLRLEGGTGLAAALDEGVAALVDALDGTTPARLLLAALGVPSAAGLDVLRELAGAGLIELRG